MEISYQLIEDDYRYGMRAWQLNSAWRRWSYRFGLVLMPVLLVGSAILLLWIPELRLVSGFSLGIAVLWLLAVYLSPRLQARMQFRRMPSAQSPMTMTFSDSGIRVQSQHYDSRVNWSTYIGWAEEKSVFVLFPQPRIYVPIPKRAFTVEQSNEFREILRRNIKPQSK
jgi:YcxB-like protein